jgi:hypothetical protein
MKNKLSLENVTLVSMTSVNIDETIFALVHSSKYINFAKVKLISHVKPKNLPSNVEFCYIEKINNINEYSYNMIYNLGNYIDTDYALIIQYDGFVINPNSWKQEFLDYDYIGAPWPLPTDSFSYRDINNKIVRIGNGGFSLRSNKLINLPNKINLPWEPFHGFYNEDGFICSKNRHIYEQNQMKFAPLELACQFSQEISIPENEGVTPFGFHGKISKYFRSFYG